MLPAPLRRNTDLLDRCDSSPEPFGLPTGQRPAPQDTALTASRRSSRPRAMLSWLWQFVLEGCAAYGLAMHPCFADPTDLSDVLGPRRDSPAEPEAASSPHLSPWHFEAP